MAVLNLDYSNNARYDIGQKLDYNTSAVWSSSSVLIRTPRLSKSAKRYIDQLSSYLTLEDNWDGNDGYAPSKIGIETSKDLVKSLDKLNQEIFFMAPSPMGDVLIELQNQCNSIEFYISMEGIISYNLFKEDEDIDEDILTISNESGLNKILVWLNISI